MSILSGTKNNDLIIIQSDTTSVQADAGTDTVVFSGDYADYTFSQSDSYVSFIKNTNTWQVVSLYDVEQLKFDYGLFGLSTRGSGEFLVNTYTTDHQLHPSIAALDGGGFVITWMSDGQDGNGYGIYAQRYDASGNLDGDEFLVNTYTTDNQHSQSIAALDGGGFVITWSSAGQDGDDSGIYAQRYDVSGSTNGNEFLVNTYTSSYQQSPSIAALDGGGFVITWTSVGQDGSSYGIYAQRYDASGNVNGDDPSLSQADISEIVLFVLGELGYSSISGFTSNWVTSNDTLTIGMDSAYLSGTGSITNVSIALDLNTNGDVSSYSGQAYSPYYGQWGYSTKSDLTALDLSAIKQTYLAIDALETISNQSTSNDIAMIALKVLGYEQISGLTSSWDREYLTSTIEVASAELDGNVITNAKVVASINSSGNIDYYSSTGTVNNQYSFSYDQYDLNDAERFVIEAGNYAMAEIDGALQTDLSDAELNVNGDEFLVNTYTSDSQLYPSIAALDGGGFVITWQSQFQDGSYDGEGIFAQRYDASGSTNGNEFQVNTYTSSSQSSPSIAALDGGGFVITWQSVGQDGDSYGIYTQRYDASGNLDGDEFLVNTYTYGGQRDPSIAALDGGGFVITWWSDGQDGDDGWDPDIYAQRYNADGSVNGAEFRVNTYVNFDQWYPSITALTDGGFVITWVSNGQDSDRSWEGNINAQRYDADVTFDVVILETNAPTVTTTIAGTTSDDILQGTTGIDNISTLEGADIVYALAGNDIITLTADAVWDSGYVARNVSNNSSVSTGEKITLNGLNRFTDVIDGGADIDSIILTSGNDAFFIDDVYSAHHSSLTLSTTTQGVDSTARMVELETINAGEGNDIIDLTSTNFVLAEAVVINGEAGNDTLWGSNGDDTIDGGTGDDSIFGGTGSDTLTGGTGADIFQFTATAGSDVITDFGVGGDTIKLYYRAEDNHTNADLSLANGILTWNVDTTTNDVVIDVSATMNSSDFVDLDALITFVEIV